MYLLLAVQAPVSGHLSPTPLVAAYENHSRKWPAPVTVTFFAFQGCQLTRASTVFPDFKFSNKHSISLTKKYKMSDLAAASRMYLQPYFILVHYDG